MLGAIREDDVPFDAGALENNPQDEPNGPFIRVRNHFFDPYNDRGLSTALAAGFSAPDWGLTGTLGSNHFNILSAREAMWRALTLKQIDASGTLSDLPFPPNFAVLGPPGAEERYREELRVAYWATTFRALGDVLHLLQDMAQPQHTRNDMHAGLGCSAGLGCALGHASYYEKYVDARATGSASFRLRERFFLSIQLNDIDTNVAVSDLSYGTYPLPQFDRYRDFFATSTGGLSLSGSGLANYSNQGFFTASTNIDSAGGGYSSPPPNPGSLQRFVIPSGAVVDAARGAIPVSGALELLKGVVQDSLNPGESDAAVALSSFGAFDQFMQPLGQRQYTLNHYNYDDQARLLIPRAVAYSAGFLDYFFRGQLEINLPSAGVYAIVDNAMPICRDTCGFRSVRLKVKNTTPAESLSNGFFVAVVKFHRNTSYQTDLSGDPGGPNFGGWDTRSLSEEIVVSDKVDVATLPGGQLATGAEAEIGFAFASPIPINASDVELQVVFRGRLGNETDALAVATKNVSEVNYVSFENDLDYYYSAATDTFAARAIDPPTQTIGNLAIRLGGAPVATLVNLPVRGYAQLAFLTDMGSASTEALAIDYTAPGCCSFGSPYSVNLPIAEFYSPGTGVYDRTRHVSRYRGLTGDYAVHMFQGSPYGYAVCSDGDTRAICTSAGLTTIPAANAVPWTIHFP